MKSLMKTREGYGLTLVESEEPHAYEDDVLIKIKYSSICGSDLHVYKWDQWAKDVGIKVPGISGHECVGEVISIGNNVSNFDVGDRVSVETHIPCGECELCRDGKQHICENLLLFGLHKDGCFAEYTSVPEICLRKVPEGIPDKVAALLEPIGVGVHAAQKGNVSGKNIAVLGAGPIGVYSGCASLGFGAAAVSISDLSDSRLNIASACADFKAWNPSNTSTEKFLSEEKNRPDVIIETTGSIHAIKEALPYLKKNGTVIMVGLFSEELPLNFSREIILKEVTIKGIHGRMMWDTWDKMEKLLLEKKLNIEPSISHIYKLTDFEDAFESALNGEGMKILFEN
ncbi:alcohol dehydrogenase catalytic domain-containing protein [Salipaludibacillus sp. CF4.18]|uniref:alcohol dehydrogenase catalytic domain-containing protein n=1 Tax=Salipaludibacillus sp. CF4.18 TaxID=3373081 RepID=UPI003EE4B101